MTGQDAAPLSVAIQAALDPRAAGGVQANLLSLVRNMAGVPDVALRLLVPGLIEEAWRAAADPAVAVSRWPFPLAWYRAPAPAPLWRRLYRKLRERAGGSVAIDHELRRLGCDLVHFPYQLAFDTSLPSIYEPWDLQHIHLPHLFDPGERAWRTETYKRACRRATLVVTATATTKRDVAAAFDIPLRKIAVVYRDSSLTAAPKSPDARRALLAGYGVTGPFVFFPAMTYPHKNHLKLIEALAIVRDRHGLRLPLVLSGRPHAGDAAVRSAAEGLGLGGQVTFVGAVSEKDLASLYTEARLLAFPSRFEGLGLPLLEAMRYSLPIAASRDSCIPEVADNAAVYFDSDDPVSIAEALAMVWRNPDLRQELARKGEHRRQAFTWDKAARLFAAIYRRAAGRKLSEDDERLVDGSLSLV